MSGPLAGPRMVEQRLAPPGTPGGDLIDGGDAASALLRPVGPDSDIDLSRPSCLSTAAFTPTSARAEAKLSTILAGDGVLVSTGQQPGLFLGPLYVLYKMFSAVSHARRIEQATGRPAVASFWVAADDHDWEEVGTARIVDRTGEIETMSIAPLPGDAGRSVGPASLGPEIRPLLDRFVAAAGESDFAVAALAPLTRGYMPGSTVSGAFQSAYAALVEGFDVLLFDPMHAEVRREAVPFLRQALEYGPRVSEAMREGTTAAISAGYDPRLRPPEAGIQVFFDDGTTRSHLLAEGAGSETGSPELCGPRRNGSRYSKPGPSASVRQPLFARYWSRGCSPRLARFSALASWPIGLSLGRCSSCLPSTCPRPRHAAPGSWSNLASSGG